MISKYFDDSYWERAWKELTHTNPAERHGNQWVIWHYYERLAVCDYLGMLELNQRYGLIPLSLTWNYSPFCFLDAKIVETLDRIREKRTFAKDGWRLNTYRQMRWALQVYVQGEYTLNELIQVEKLHIALREAK